MKFSSKIYIAGNTGMVGSAIVRRLIEEGYWNIIGKPFEELDLTNQKAVTDFFTSEKPEYVFLAAAKVGGILANDTYRAQFIYENLMIQNNIIHNAYLNGVKKLLFLGSSCIYPKNAPQPLKEEYLLTGELEYTNEPYAIAKIAGIKMCESYNTQYGTNFISVMPTNLYGSNDNYNLETSHVLPAILRKVHLAHCLETGNWEGIRKDLTKRPIETINGNSTEDEILSILKKFGIELILEDNYNVSVTRHVSCVTLWGSGQVFREFMHVDDMASACVKIMKELNIKDFFMHHPSRITFLNIGTGLDQTIYDLSLIIKKIIGFKGEIKFDQIHSDGTFKKLLDISQLQTLGFLPQYTLDEGIKMVYQNYIG